MCCSLLQAPWFVNGLLVPSSQTDVVLAEKESDLPQTEVNFARSLGRAAQGSHAKAVGGGDHPELEQRGR